MCELLALSSSQPVQHAFCALLSRLRVLWEAASPPPLQACQSVLARFAADLRALGPANFLYADGDAEGELLVARSGRLVTGDNPGL